MLQELCLKNFERNPYFGLQLSVKPIPKNYPAHILYNVKKYGGFQIFGPSIRSTQYILITFSPIIYFYINTHVTRIMYDTF